MAKADSGATRHYFTNRDAHILKNKTHLSNGPRVKLPNNESLQATIKGVLPLSSQLSTTAKEAHVFPHIKNALLISIGQLCDDHCIAIFDKKQLNVFKNNKNVLSGTRNTRDGLWDVPLQQNEIELQANMIIRKDQTKTELANYLHACAFSPALSTLQQAKHQGHLLTWPGINEINLVNLSQKKQQC